jgi:hypothetical protein
VPGDHLGGDLAFRHLIGAEMGKGRIAAQHLAAARIHHAAADRRAKLKPDFVKSLKQCRHPGKPG